MLAEGPDFIGVGVQKCGTTWVAARLAEHPQVFLDKKEISFWTNHFHRGYRWYQEHFKDRAGRVAGEVSPNYFIAPRPRSGRLEHYPRWSLQSWWKHLRRPYPSARDEIRRMYPAAKVFAVFRNPVDRAWSHYWMWVERKRKTRKARLVTPFDRMFRDDGRWIRYTGLYATHLKYWLDAFPDMGVFLYDDLVADPAAFIASVYRFVGVDEAFAGRLTNRENARRYEPMGEKTRRMVLDCYRDEIEEFSKLTGRSVNWLG